MQIYLFFLIYNIFLTKALFFSIVVINKTSYPIPLFISFFIILCNCVACLSIIS